MFVFIVVIIVILNNFDEAFGRCLLTFLVGNREVKMILTKRRIGWNIDVLVELYILDTYIFTIGKRFLDFETAAFLLMNFDVDSAD